MAQLITLPGFSPSIYCVVEVVVHHRPHPNSQLPGLAMGLDIGAGRVLLWLRDGHHVDENCCFLISQRSREYSMSMATVTVQIEKQ